MSIGRWTPADDARLRAMRAKGMSNRDIAEALGRSFHAIEKRASRLFGDKANARSVVDDARLKAEPPAAPAVKATAAEIAAIHRNAIARGYITTAAA